MWWLFATGREIMENGIPYMNPFSIYDDQQIVIQQWLPAVIDWLVYSNFEFLGIGIMVLVLTLALAASAFWVSRIVMGKAGDEIAWCVIAAMIGCCSAYLSIRPQVWSMIAFLLILGVLEKYRRGANAKILAWLPVIVLVHANCHMSMMPFDFVIMICYLIPWKAVGAIKFTDNDYKRLPMLAATAVMMVAACLNPYGIDGAMYLVNSLGAAEYGNYISEMGKIAPWGSYYGILMIVMIMIGSIGIGRNGLSCINAPLTLLFIGCAFLSLMHVRNVWLVSIFAFVLFCSSIRGLRLAPKAFILRDDTAKIAVGALACVTVLLVGFGMMTKPLMKEAKDGTTTPIVAAGYLDKVVSERGQDKDDIKVFTHFNAGGFLEYSGYKVSMDARPELWDDKIAKSGHDRYHEYIDFTKGDLSENAYLSDKDFDYLVVNTDTDLYKHLMSSIDYAVAESGDGYAVFERSKWRSGGASAAMDDVSDIGNDAVDGADDEVTLQESYAAPVMLNIPIVKAANNNVR